MDLVPTKLPELSQNSLRIFESKFNKPIEQNYNKNKLYPYCGEKKNQKIKYLIENEQEKKDKQQIDMNQLQWLLEVLNNTQDEVQSHEIFMNSYHKILSKTKNENKEPINQKKKVLLPEISTAKSSKTSTSNDTDLRTIASTQLAIKNGIEENNDTSDEDEELKKAKLDQERIKAHDVRYYTEVIHNKKVEVDDEYAKKREMLKHLKKLVKKYPFERTVEENKEIFKILSTFDDFMSLFPKSIQENTRLLEELCGYAIIERVNSKNNPIFGSFGFYLVLTGSVNPVSVPHINRQGLKLRSITPEPDDHLILGEGNCFGTITELKDRDLSTRMFRVITLEDKCEFLKISIGNYNKVTKKINDQEREEKIKTIKSCESYSKWPKHIIEELMEIFEWRIFEPNTILTSEGYHCPFIGFIKEGECHVLRKVDVPFINRKTGIKEKRLKQVIVGKLKPNESFGEISVIMKEPMTCSIVTDNQCKVGLIPCDQLNKLEPITLRLLLQTNRTFGDLSEKEIFEKFIQQQKNKEWKHFKSRVINDVLEKSGIVNGYGKYKMHHKDENENKE